MIQTLKALYHKAVLRRMERRGRLAFYRHAATGVCIALSPPSEDVTVAYVPSGGASVALRAFHPAEDLAPYEPVPLPVAERSHPALVERLIELECR